MRIHLMIDLSHIISSTPSIGAINLVGLVPVIEINTPRIFNARYEPLSAIDFSSIEDMTMNESTPTTCGSTYHDALTINCPRRVAHIRPLRVEPNYFVRLVEIN